MRNIALCTMVLGLLQPLTGSLQTPEMLWVCDEPGCEGKNDCDREEGCNDCKEREREMEENNNEYYRDILDATDPEGAPHSWEEAEEFERSIQSK